VRKQNSIELHTIIPSSYSLDIPEAMSDAITAQSHTGLYNVVVGFIEKKWTKHFNTLV
jgi:hypothetical protein